MTQARPLFKLLSVQDVMNRPPPAWLVENVLQSDSHAMIYGAPGSYKTFAALDLACHIAIGAEWHGRKTKQGPVIYVATESLGGIGRRLEAWQEAHESEVSEHLHFLEDAVQLHDGAHIKELVKITRRSKTCPVLLRHPRELLCWRQRERSEGCRAARVWTRPRAASDRRVLRPRPSYKSEGRVSGQ